MKVPVITGPDGTKRYWLQNAHKEQVQPINGTAIAILSNNTRKDGAYTPLFFGAVQGKPVGADDLTPKQTRKMKASSQIAKPVGNKLLERVGFVGVYVTEEDYILNL